MTRTQLLAGLAALVVLGVGISLGLQRTRGRDDATLAVAHTTTVVAETLYVHDTVERVKAVTAFRTLRDTTLLHLTDTLLVKQVIARADTVIAKDSAALQAADRVIAAKDAELHEALKPVYAPRLTTTVATLYDPLSGGFSGAGGVSLRVLGPVSLVARVEQRPVLERPAVRIGISLSF